MYALHGAPPQDLAQHLMFRSTTQMVHQTSKKCHQVQLVIEYVSLSTESLCLPVNRYFTLIETTVFTFTWGLTWAVYYCSKLYLLNKIRCHKLSEIDTTVSF